MTTIGYATLQIIPSLSGVSKSINKQLAAERDMGKDAGRLLGANIATGALASGPGKKIGKELEAGVAKGAEGAAGQVKTRLSERLGAQVGLVVGKGIGGGISAGIKVGELALKGALVGAAGVASVALGGVGLALTKGFDRLKSIDQAKFKLQALGNDAASVSKIMDSALKSVKGTAFGMDEAVTAAASAVAAGIKPGQDLTKYLTEVGDAASIAGSSFTDMGSIFNKIQTSNKAYTDDLNQLADRGLPIFKWLQTEYGVTGEALSKMVQNGEVDAAHFQHAIETNIGGAAQKMGQSFEGSVQNAEAALGRLGAALLAPVFGTAAGGIGSITDGLDNMTKWVDAHKPEIVGFFTDMGVAAVSVAQDIVKSFGNIIQGAGDFTHALGTAIGLFDADKGRELQAVGDTLNGIGDKLISTADKFDAAKDKIRGWGDAARQAAENAQGAYGPVTGLGTALGALPFKKVIAVQVDTGDADSKIAGVGNALGRLPFKKNIELTVNGQAWANGATGPTFDGVPLPAWANDPNHPLIGPQNNGPVLTPNRNGIPILHKASGGGVFGAGSATSDSIPAWLSNGEHVWPTDEVNKAGGQAAMYRLRGRVKSGALRGFATGGGIGQALSYRPSGHIGRGIGAYDSNKPTGGGNFNPGIAIDTSTTSVAPPGVPWDPNRFLFGDILKSIPGAYGPKDRNPYHPNLRYVLDGSRGSSIWGPGFAGGGAIGWFPAGDGLSSKPMGHIGRGANAYDANKPTGGGNFNPNMLIDTSTTTVSGPPKFWEPNQATDFFFGDIAKHGIGGGKIGKGIPFHKRRFDPQAGGMPNGNIWNLPGFAGGGAVGPDVAAAESLVGTPYSRAKRFDCSGDVARVINAALGIDGGSLMTTASASQWLSALGFKRGIGGPGSISVGWKNGGPGGGHMAMTLSDGRNAEGGGSHPNFLVGAGAAGASSAQFTDHMYLALAAASDAVAGQDTTGQGDNSAASTAGSSGGGAGALPDSISGLAGFGLSGLGAGVGTTKSGSDLSLFGNAAASAVGGQVDSALGVLGINGSPGWLKAATQLVGGLKVGGHDPSGQSDGSIFNGANPLGGFGQGSAAPLSATSTATGTPPPDDAGNMHGTRAGQQPGPQTVFNIRTATVDDAFLAAKRKQDERYAAKLSRY